MKNTFIPTQNYVTKRFHLIDAENKTLGRLSSEISLILTGKKKAIYTPFLSIGDYVTIINAEKIVLSSNKDKQKIYKMHSGRPGGLRIKTFKKIQQDYPEKIILNAVKGMLPKGSLGRKIYKNLKVYKGTR